MRRIALIADLHGNLPAVEALEQDLKTRSVDEIWCLGDIVGKGPSSPDTFDWAMAHCSLILRGNFAGSVVVRHPRWADRRALTKWERLGRPAPALALPPGPVGSGHV